MTKNSEEVEVWDLPVRVFHWSLVAAFATAFLTAGVYGRLHEAAGYSVMALVTFRVFWGFTGTRHARFSDFVATPGTILAYLGGTLRGGGKRHLGHNPAGGAMILALLGLCGALGVTGWLQNTTWFFGSETLNTIHWAIAWFTVGIIPLHLAGVVVSSLLHHENLVKAMFTGRKPAYGASAGATSLTEALADRTRAANVFALIAIGIIAAQWLWPQVNAQIEINARRAKIAAKIEADREAKLAALANPRPKKAPEAVASREATTMVRSGMSTLEPGTFTSVEAMRTSGSLQTPAPPAVSVAEAIIGSDGHSSGAPGDEAEQPADTMNLADGPYFGCGPVGVAVSGAEAADGCGVTVAQLAPVATPAPQVQVAEAAPGVSKAAAPSETRQAAEPPAQPAPPAAQVAEVVPSGSSAKSATPEPQVTPADPLTSQAQTESRQARSAEQRAAAPVERPAAEQRAASQAQRVAAAAGARAQARAAEQRAAAQAQRVAAATEARAQARVAEQRAAAQAQRVAAATEARAQARAAEQRAAAQAQRVAAATEARAQARVAEQRAAAQAQRVAAATEARAQARTAEQRAAAQAQRVAAATEARAQARAAEQRAAAQAQRVAAAAEARAKARAADQRAAAQAQRVAAAAEARAQARVAERRVAAQAARRVAAADVAKAARKVALKKRKKNTYVESAYAFRGNSGRGSGNSGGGGGGGGGGGNSGSGNSGKGSSNSGSGSSNSGSGSSNSGSGGGGGNSGKGGGG